MSLQPLCVRSMRTGVDSRSIGKQAAARRPEQLGAEAQRIIGRMAGAEHPLVAAHGAHAAAHLVGQRLEAERAVGGGQRAGDRGARPMRRPARRGRCRWPPRSGASAGWYSRQRESARRRVPRDRAAECGSDGWRRERTARARAGRGCRSRGGSDRAPGTRRAESASGSPAQTESSERSRISGSVGGDDVDEAAHSRPPCRQFAVGQQFHQSAKALLARSRPCSASASCAVSRP